jgi:predicted alpha/beta superfamily hydrolase
MADWLDYEDAFEGGGSRIAGTVKVLRDVRSAELGNTRDILVYLPPSYPTANRTYPTLYMHDGQNLFDEATSFAGEWRVDEALEELAEEGIEAIVVGVPNTGSDRLNEYSPFHDARFGGGRAADYVKFIVDTVKPLVDEAFRTTGERDGTGTIGSSMGGLISLYAFFERPDVFGAVGAVSPSVGFARGALIAYLERARFVGGRIYLDVGTHEGRPRDRDPLHLRGKPGAYVRMVRDARDLLVRKGYREGPDLLYVEEEGAVHNEAAWAERLPQLLRFLLG